MRITAKVDDAVRVLVELARQKGADTNDAAAVKALTLADAIDVPPTTLLDVLADLRRGGLVRSQRGPEGGWRLAKPAGEIDIARVIRVVEGPLAAVQGIRPDDLVYPEEDAVLQRMWIAVRANLRAVLEATTVAHLRDGELPKPVEALTGDPDAWTAH